MTTDEELIQKAIDLCTSIIAYTKTRLDFIYSFYHIDTREAEEKKQMKRIARLAKTHLAELEEHRPTLLSFAAFRNGDGEMYTDQCEKCPAGEMYLCQVALAKAKRLLAVE